MIRYAREHDGACLLCDYTITEAEGPRLVCANASFVCLVPYWALWPFETLVLAREHVSSLVALTQTQREDLADILGRLTRRYGAYLTTV